MISSRKILQRIARTPSPANCWPLWSRLFSKHTDIGSRRALRSRLEKTASSVFSVCQPEILLGGGQSPSPEDFRSATLLELFEDDLDKLLALIDLFHLNQGDVHEQQRILEELREALEEFCALEAGLIWPTYKTLEAILHQEAGIIESEADLTNMKKIIQQACESHLDDRVTPGFVDRLTLVILRHGLYSIKNLFHLFVRVPRSRLVQLGKEWKKMKFQLRERAHAHKHPEAIKTA